MNANTLDRDQLKANLSDSQVWLRLVYMALFVIMLNIAGVLMWGICLVQFVFVAATGATNSKLLSLGASLGRYIHQVLDFLSFNSEQRPFPFADWPFANQENADEDVTRQTAHPDAGQEPSGQTQSSTSEVIALGRDTTDKTNPPTHE